MLGKVGFSMLAPVAVRLGGWLPTAARTLKQAVRPSLFQRFTGSRLSTSHLDRCHAHRLTLIASGTLGKRSFSTHSFRAQVASKPDTRLLLQGNGAFALGVVHAGYRSADGYPGTPSTEVIDRYLLEVPDKIKAGWSVNEATAFGMGLGRSIAGEDTLVTMKIPGVFQAGDIISSAANSPLKGGALVLYVGTDFVPSSTQHLVDPRAFFASCRLPVLEPRNHQEIYKMAKIAARVSKQFQTIVVILASGRLCHSDGMINTDQVQQTSLLDPSDLRSYISTPAPARVKYDQIMTTRMPALQDWAEHNREYITEIPGSENWGVIVAGEHTLVLSEALQAAGSHPHILSLAITNPIPEARIKAFSETVGGKLFVLEDGDRFLQEKLKALGLPVIGKEKFSTRTTWTPGALLAIFAEHSVIKTSQIHPSSSPKTKAPNRPPAICPGCSYKAFSMVVDKFKKEEKLLGVFGDIGCNTLLFGLNALDSQISMGASEPMRQGFVSARPEMAHRFISLIGDSTDSHTGHLGTRNAIFRGIPGVKVILDNATTAMTGHQPRPSINMKKVLEAEGASVIEEDAYDIRGLEQALEKSLKSAEEGKFATLIVKGSCIHVVDKEDRTPPIYVDHERCVTCKACTTCEGIEFNEESKKIEFTDGCSTCGGGSPVCMQICHFEGARAIDFLPEAPQSAEHFSGASPNTQQVEAPDSITTSIFNIPDLPPAIRVGVRGIGGQGNLFFGKVLSEVAFKTPYKDGNIIKGDTLGMAQLGGPVISTFSCGDVHSSELAPGTADVLVAMERSEVLRSGFLDLLKPGGTIILNDYRVLPQNVKTEDYPKIEDIEAELHGYKVIKINASQIAREMGEPRGRHANVIVIGLLSTLPPFNKIPKAIWLSALYSISRSNYQKNKLAFENGINFLN